MRTETLLPPGSSIAVIGSGIAGLSAAWLLGTRHRVTLYEAGASAGGHTNTVEVDDGGQALAIDTGFIVYNQQNYPNLVRLFEHFGVATASSNMSFAASLRDGRCEYAGTDVGGLLAQPRNLLRPRFWRMLGELRRFYRDASGYLTDGTADLTLGALLERHRYPAAFIDDHLVPMAAAIWSASAHDILGYPARSFIEFFRNHELFELGDRAPWRTVTGGARTYVARLLADFRGVVRRDACVTAVERHGNHVDIRTDADSERFDHVVLATHADQAVRLLERPSAVEASVLGAFAYTRNHAVLHTDTRLMPRRRRAWAAWNYLERGTRAPDQPLCVSYWMNRLQPLRTSTDWVITLNPPFEPAPALTHYATTYEHPQFDHRALAAQGRLWSLQGVNRTWYCGSYFGYGFHEDALQAGLLVAEQLGGVARPWTLPDVPSRVPLPPAGFAPTARAAA